MAVKKRKRSLAHGRPLSVSKPKVSLSSKATRILIRSHHELERALARAERDGDDETAASISAQIQKQGGLQSYQQASILGQSASRGGDSSRILLEWLKPILSNKSRERPLRVLEVGALSVDNAISKSAQMDMTRIDLNSQHPGIRKQDFMKMEFPVTETDKYDLLSLSLVLNYVPDPEGRGAMLQRTCHFLSAHGEGGATHELLPSLFLVLPAPCVTNSRYLDEGRLVDIMKSLGYSLSRRKLSSKLMYFLWCFNAKPKAATSFKKQEINPGKTRNNFTIVLK